MGIQYEVNVFVYHGHDQTNKPGRLTKQEKGGREDINIRTTGEEKGGGQTEERICSH